MPRKLYEIAKDILADPAFKNAAYYAIPYVRAMASMNSISDDYGLDSGKEIVLRFLCNVQTWRGETARNIKKELKDLLR